MGSLAAVRLGYTLCWMASGTGMPLKLVGASSCRRLPAFPASGPGQNTVDSAYPTGPVDSVVDVSGTDPWPSGWVWAPGSSSVASNPGAVAVSAKLPNAPPAVSAAAEERWPGPLLTTRAATAV